MEKKNFGIALLLWAFMGTIGVHRAYIKDSFVPLLWYWLATIFTLGIIVIVDLFLIKSQIEKKHLNDTVKKMATEYRK